MSNLCLNCAVYPWSFSTLICFASSLFSSDANHFHGNIYNFFDTSCNSDAINSQKVEGIRYIINLYDHTLHALSFFTEPKEMMIINTALL